ncbi:hypothetical protein MHO82_08255 [Vibrio sp. Of7-15]|uniref:capsular polysaccharide export protein, LipB/KpsS family n=1 Tax=Vibrio sp. Of7-15 TaxID=2724879 RepID=UPI001EF1E8EB|nr:hypothetical protein [Vibrio sp. Of7-15]MCG7496852.1 hypothetical protein [Vibrio sp. Of7-15]
MMSNLFLKMVESNRLFWSDVNKKDDDNGCLLYEMFYSEPEMIYGISKTALTIAKQKSLKPICITGLRGKKERFSLINSMNDTVVGDLFSFFKSSAISVVPILKTMISIRNKKDLLNLEIDGYKVGHHIYDAILKALYIPEINKMTLPVRKILLLEICYFYFFKKIIENEKVKVIVLGDNVYRCGLLFELARHNNIECITPINLNGFSMCRYIDKGDFENHDRKPDMAVLKSLDNNFIDNYLESYFSKRFGASLEHHDVLKAFSNDKTVYNKLDIIKQYGLNKDLPIVVVMSHIFCDAPHSYPGMIYDDYKHWLVNTIKNLKKNKKVNFLIKEHPSADLYNEKGVINKILKDLDCEHLLLKEDVHNLTILNYFDVVVTCGGTIGQEFAYKGKPVVLAAQPPYSGFGFTVEPGSKDLYEELMRTGIESLELLGKNQKEMVNKVLYHDFVLLDSYSDDLELGGERFYIGREFDYDRFSKKIIDYNKVPIDNQIMYKKLENYILSDKKHLLREEEV